MKIGDGADFPQKARQTSFQRQVIRDSISKIQAFLTSLEVLTKSLEYNPEQYFLLLGVFQ